MGTAPDGKEYRFENKARGAGFDSILALLTSNIGLKSVELETGELIAISLDPNKVIANAVFLNIAEFDKEHQKVFRSIGKKCRNWIGNAEILSLKQDRRPFVYIRWFK